MPMQTRYTPRRTGKDQRVPYMPREGPEGSMTQFGYNPAPKPNHKRNNPKRGNATKFSPKTRRAIVERDNALCVRCKRLYHSIHHITFASALGTGTFRNGACVCISCHSWAHSGKEGREWFESYRERMIEDEE